MSIKTAVQMIDEGINGVAALNTSALGASVNVYKSFSYTGAGYLLMAIDQAVFAHIGSGKKLTLNALQNIINRERQALREARQR